MKVGLFYEWPNPEASDWKTLFEQSIEQIQQAEELGFDFVLVAEHHFSNYGMSPAPLLQALAIAERTKTIRVGTGVLVLPIWQPLRAAEEVAVLDNLTNGRFICGVGRGYQAHEFGHFGVESEDTRERFSEALDVMIKAWTSDTAFGFEGKHFQVPGTVNVWPKPLQKPHPPLWLAGTSADSLRLAAQRDIAPIISGYGGGDDVRTALSSLLPLRSAAGLPADRWDMGIQTISLVADSLSQARADLKYARWQNRANRALRRLDVHDGRVNAVPYEGEPDDETFWNMVYYGDPGRLIEKYASLAENGATFVSSWQLMGGVEHEKVMRSIRLMGTEVIPAVRDAHASPELVESLLAAAAAPDALEQRGPPPAD